jgi:thiamine biosynthesis protein ThiS
VKLIVNGDEREVPEGLTVHQLLEHLDVPVGRVAVEVNLEVVPKARFAACTLQDGDRLEIVTFVGGG